MNFALGTASTDVKAKYMEVLRHIEDNLRGEFVTSAQALVSPEIFDQLTSHDKVVKAYERWREGAALRDDMRAGFTYGGITFEEYRGQLAGRSARPRVASEFFNSLSQQQT